MTNLGPKLDEFFSSDAVGWLIASAKENRALKIAFPREVNISNLFGWLFDSNEGHGLGDLALKTLLLKAWQAANEASVPERVAIRPTEVHKVSFSNAVVLREFKTSESANRVDLVVVDQSNKLLIGIENKYGAKQGPEQLKRYADALEKLLAGKQDWRLVMVLLDYDEDSQPKDERWVKLSYEWVSELINTQLELGLLSDESATTLQQFAEHLDDEGLAPYPGLAEEEATTKILELVHAHSDVFKAMRELSGLDVVQSVTELLTQAQGPLALEYIRHRDLWDHVLETGAKAQLLVPLQNKFRDIESDLSSSRCRSYFIRTRWLSCWNAEEEEKDDKIWPLYVTFYQSERRDDLVRVSADFFPESIKEAQRLQLKEIALALRKSNGLSKKGLKEDAKRIRVAEFTFKTVDEARKKLLETVQSVDQAFFG